MAAQPALVPVLPAMAQLGVFMASARVFAVYTAWVLRGASPAAGQDKG